MNKYDTPPVLLASDLRQVFSAYDADRAADARIETTPARFIVFAGDRTWVLRDYKAGRDYPFLTRQGAHDCAELIVTEGFTPPISSPSDIYAYGEPLENVEALA